MNDAELINPPLRLDWEKAMQDQAENDDALIQSFMGQIWLQKEALEKQLVTWLKTAAFREAIRIFGRNAVITLSDRADFDPMRMRVKDLLETMSVEGREMPSANELGELLAASQLEGVQQIGGEMLFEKYLDAVATMHKENEAAQLPHDQGEV